MSATLSFTKATGDLLTAAEVMEIVNLFSTKTDNSETELKSTLTTTMGIVVHGSTAGAARPIGYTSIIWIGSVDPTNAIDNDILFSIV